MYQLPPDPRLSTLTITRGGAQSYSYMLNPGQEFPEGAEATMVVTDRAGGLLGTFYAEVAGREATWLITPEELEFVPAGSNFEVFITIDDVYKVRYGRVVRKEVSFPLHPDSTDIFDAVQFEDDMQRDIVGSRWIEKSGRLWMHTDNTLDTGMGSRNGFILPFWSRAAGLYYAPIRSDTVELSVKLRDGGDGTTIIVVNSNYSMSRWLGIKFADLTGVDHIQAVTGTGPLTYASQGSTYNHIVDDVGFVYTIRYSQALDKVSVYIESGLTPVLEWSDVSNVVPHGAGYRYTGLVFDSTLFSTGPLVTYWKAKDDV